MNNPMQTHGAPSWIQHHGPDPVAARKFYETTFGWAVNDMPMQDGSAYPAIMVGDAPVGGFMPQPMPNGSWMIYITVDDVDARFKKALAGGANAVSEPMDIPGVGRMAAFADPFGAVISVFKYETPQE
ncbi:MAG: hypothetical protein COA52_02550 [Hyphomicrobiales bacterium]|nr:VOC family protein [Hyphomicrobiales bacterium]PCJ95942.1 MAG: hypothetical protein COA52_02550 [Hyphomicrobiales bacterium]